MRSAIAGSLVGFVADGRGPGQPCPEQSVGDPLSRARFQLVPQRALAQNGAGAQQIFDDGQRTGDVTVVETLTNAGETVRPTMSPIDGLQTRQRSPGQGDQQFLSADLGRVVIERDQHTADQTDSVLLAPALHQVRPVRPLRSPIRIDRRTIRYQRGGDQRMQPVGCDRTGVDQFQVGRRPGRRIG